MFKKVIILAFSALALYISAEESPAVKVGGFAAPQFSANGGNEVTNEFRLKHARIHAIGKINKQLNGFMQIESKTANTGLQNAYINYLPVKGIEARFGYIKLPFGNEAFGHPLKNPTIDISQASKKTYRGAHDMGFHLRYKHKIGQYWAAVVNGNNGSAKDNNSRKDFCGRALLTPVAGLGLGGSFYAGKRGAEKLATNRFGAEVSYKRGPLGLKGEWLYASDEQETDSHINSMGHYVAAAYRFAECIEPVARFDLYDPDIETGGNTFRNITVGIGYYFPKNTWNRFSVNYEIRNADGTSGADNLATAQLQVLF